MLSFGLPSRMFLVTAYSWLSVKALFCNISGSFFSHLFAMICVICIHLGRQCFQSEIFFAIRFWPRLKPRFPLCPKETFRFSSASFDSYQLLSIFIGSFNFFRFFQFSSDSFDSLQFRSVLFRFFRFLKPDVWNLRVFFDSAKCSINPLLDGNGLSEKQKIFLFFFVILNSQY